MPRVVSSIDLLLRLLLGRDWLSLHQGGVLSEAALLLWLALAETIILRHRIPRVEIS